MWQKRKPNELLPSPQDEDEASASESDPIETSVSASASQLSQLSILEREARQHSRAPRAGMGAQGEGVSNKDDSTRDELLSRGLGLSVAATSSSFKRTKSNGTARQRTPTQAMPSRQPQPAVLSRRPSKMKQEQDAVKKALEEAKHVEEFLERILLKDAKAAISMLKDPRTAPSLLDNFSAEKWPTRTRLVPFVITMLQMTNAKDKDGVLWTWLLKAGVVEEVHLSEALDVVCRCDKAIALCRELHLFTDVLDKHTAPSTRTCATNAAVDQGKTNGAAVDKGKEAVAELMKSYDYGMWKGMGSVVKQHATVLREHRKLKDVFSLLIVRNGARILQLWNEHVAPLTRDTVFRGFGWAVNHFALHTAETLWSMGLVGLGEMGAVMEHLVHQSKSPILIGYVDRKIRETLDNMKRSTATTKEIE